jgi:hypothetical protein
VNELNILYNAALIVRNNLKAHDGIKIPWPPLSTDITIDNVKKSVPIMLFNFLAWCCGCSSEAILEDLVNVDEQSSSRLFSICQDIIFFVSNGKAFTTKHVAISMAIRQLTRNTQLTSMLNNFGHCMSHSYTLYHETALAERNISSSAIIPDGFSQNVSTVLAWDNDDFSEETSTGNFKTFCLTILKIYLCILM